MRRLSSTNSLVLELFENTHNNGQADAKEDAAIDISKSKYMIYNRVAMGV